MAKANQQGLQDTEYRPLYFQVKESGSDFEASPINKSVGVFPHTCYYS